MNSSASFNLKSDAVHTASNLRYLTAVGAVTLGLILAYFLISQGSLSGLLVSGGEENVDYQLVLVKGVIIDSTSHSPVVLLEDSVETVLPIWIGYSEAFSIQRSLARQKPERPMTHDLFKYLFDSFDVEIEKVLITKVVKNTFYADIYVNQKDKATVVLDSRPSDAIALAVRYGAAIYVHKEVLENYGVKSDPKKRNRMPERRKI